MNGEEFKELCIERDLVDSGVFLYTVEEVGLFVVVGGKDYIVDDSLQDLRKLENIVKAGWTYVPSEVSSDLPQQPQYPGPVDNACMHPDICHRASPG